MSSSTRTDLPARGALRALLPALAGHRIMMARTCGAALMEQGSLVTLLTLAAHTVGTAVIEDRAPSAGTVSALVVLVLVRTLMTWREMDLSHDLAYRVLAELRVRVFDGLARSAPARVAGRLQRRPGRHRHGRRRGTGVLLRPHHRSTPRIRGGVHRRVRCSGHGGAVVAGGGGAGGRAARRGALRRRARTRGARGPHPGGGREAVGRHRGDRRRVA